MWLPVATKCRLKSIYIIRSGIPAGFTIPNLVPKRAPRNQYKELNNQEEIQMKKEVLKDGAKYSIENLFLKKQ